MTLYSSTGNRDAPTVGQPRLSRRRGCNAGSSPPRPSGPGRHPSAALQRPGSDRRHAGRRLCRGRHFCRGPAEGCSAISTFQTKRAGRPAAVYVSLFPTCLCWSGLFLSLLCTFPVFGFVGDAVSSRHRPTAVCTEDVPHAVLCCPHRLWRRGKSGPACQQCVHPIPNLLMRVFFFFLKVSFFNQLLLCCRTSAGSRRRRGY